MVSRGVVSFFSGWCWVAPVCECPDLGRTRDCWRIAGVSAQEGSEGGWPCYSAASEWWALVPRSRGSLAFVRVCIALAGVCFFRVAPQWPSIIVARGRARAGTGVAAAPAVAQSCVSRVCGCAGCVKHCAATVRGTCRRHGCAVVGRRPARPPPAVVVMFNWAQMSGRCSACGYRPTAVQCGGEGVPRWCMNGLRRPLLACLTAVRMSAAVAKGQVSAHFRVGVVGGLLLFGWMSATRQVWHPSRPSMWLQYVLEVIAQACSRPRARPKRPLTTFPADPGPDQVLPWPAARAAPLPMARQTFARRPLKGHVEWAFCGRTSLAGVVWSSWGGRCRHAPTAVERRTRFSVHSVYVWSLLIDTGSSFRPTCVACRDRCLSAFHSLTAPAAVARRAIRHVSSRFAFPMQLARSRFDGCRRCQALLPSHEVATGPELDHYFHHAVFHLCR